MKHIARFALASLTAITLIATSAAQNRSAKKPDEAARARGLFIAKNPKSDAMSFLVLNIDGGSLVRSPRVPNSKPGMRSKSNFKATSRASSTS